MQQDVELNDVDSSPRKRSVVSETGLVYTFTSPKFQPVVAKPEGKRFIQECLDATVLSHLSSANTDAHAHTHALQRPQQQQATEATVSAFSQHTDCADKPHHPNAAICNSTHYT
ncbi:hypothetical protein INT46_000108 [Mucor plumbeus]|uniref:Uncharacterized protein n=1 Tax=Mucor plumbeus TaxID=97098 RepID=A0A8H7R934_9FUNG|nr:hypothetical protein INT46_000108 [Mucor plumbeus]